MKLSDLMKLMMLVAKINDPSAQRAVGQTVLMEATEPDSLRELLADYLSTIARDGIAHPAYWHDNGFSKVPLAVVKHGKVTMKARLHVKPALGPGETPIVVNTHEHRWELWSAILAGWMRHEQLELCSSSDEDAECLHEYLYTARGVNSHYMVEFVRMNHVRATHTGVFRAGDTYFLPSGVLHRIEFARDLVATLVFTLEDPARNQLRSPDMLLRSTPMPTIDGSRVVSQPYDLQQVSAVIEELLGALANPT